jgi:hypothetical protein
MHDRLECLSGAASERMHAHDIAAADMGKE